MKKLFVLILCVTTLIYLIPTSPKATVEPTPVVQAQAIIEAPSEPIVPEVVPEPTPEPIAVVEPVQAPEPVYVAPTPPRLSGGCPELRTKLLALGVGEFEIDSAIILAQRESSCNEYARNGDGGACGYFQSLPCGKWGQPGSDTYLPGAINYVRNRYGDYNAALAHSYSMGWY